MLKTGCPDAWPQQIVESSRLFRESFAPLPRLSAQGAIGAGSSGGAHLGVYRGTRHPAEAAALARFLTGRDAERAMALGAMGCVM